MTPTFKSDDKKQKGNRDDSGKTKAQASHDVMKPKAEEPDVETMVEDFKADDRTPTGVAVMPKTGDTQVETEHNVLDQGVDPNAPKVDPGHIRNAVNEANGYVPQQERDEELRKEMGQDDEEKEESEDEELDPEAVKAANRK